MNRTNSDIRYKVKTNAIAEARTALGFTQAELAELISITLKKAFTRESAAQIEHGYNMASAQQAVVISRILKKPISELFEQVEAEE
jgi:transcriptional regulator with XRE-family HTH domain